ncbi:type II toxin-antitoxin system VapB family antitoxin [Rhodopila sp.]|uniref:type II toxin-antitoxin system VapB family antitoxin n=1 Tax=Rhodopila sp. TaxID=2480087 RepID=UPI003D131B1B
MRTNIEIDDRLMADTIRATGATTKRAVVEQGLQVLVRLAAQRRAVEDILGLGWDVDLDANRASRDQ